MRGDREHRAWTVAAVVVASALLGSACSFSEDGDDFVAAVEVWTFCEMADEFAIVDAALLDAQDGRFDRIDALGVTWRYLLGSLRLSARSGEEGLTAIGVDSVVLDRTALTPVPPSDGWTSRQVEVAVAIASELERECDVSVEGGFLVALGG